MKSYDASKPFKELYGEPVVRPDTFELELYRSQFDGIIEHLGRGAVSVFSSEEVLAIGEGNYDDGAMRIGRAHYEADAAVFNTSGFRQLHNSLLPTESNRS